MRRYVRSQGRAPTLDTIARSVGVRSLSTVHDCLARLQEAGYIHRVPGEPRGIYLVDPIEEDGAAVFVPELKTSFGHGHRRHALRAEGAHHPLPTTKHGLHVDRGLLGGAGDDDVLLVVVRDFGMAPDGITRDDRVVVDTSVTEPFDDGSLVAVLLEDLVVVRRVARVRSRTWLRPSAPSYTRVDAADVHAFVVGEVVLVLRTVRDPTPHRRRDP